LGFVRSTGFHPVIIFRPIRVDFHNFKEAVDDIGYQDWLIIESATGNKWYQVLHRNIFLPGQP